MEGKIEGKIEKAFDIAKSLKSQKVDINIIVVSTGLSKEEIDGIILN